ncbi:MAG: MinD/ParA family protein [Acidobacteria bacterium]|nr:MinD/ParA family protein [Acidobacteriota bacterium]
MSDLIGDSLEKLVRGDPEAGLSKIPDDEGASAQPVAAPAPGLPAAPPATAMRTAITHPQPRRAAADSPATAFVVAVASGKGGTGKSLIAVNLAVALAESQRVGLIDLDLGLANAHILLGLLPRFDVSHLLRGERSLDDVLLAGPRGVLVLPGASGIPEMAGLDDSSLGALASAIAPLMARSDIVLLDCPAGLSRQSIVFLHGADLVLVVTTEDLTSMTDAYALIKTLVTHRPQASVGLLVNDARSAMDGAETYRKISHVARKFLGREILSMGTIPRDAYLERSVRERRPVVLAHPTAPSSRALLELTGRLADREPIDSILNFSQRVGRVLTAAGVGSVDPVMGDACAS